MKLESKWQIGDREIAFMHAAIAMANEGEESGNLPIGAVIVLDDVIIGEGHNRIVKPHYHPGRHAEIEAYLCARPILGRSQEHDVFYDT